jgi:hypothetical protein
MEEERPSKKVRIGGLQSATVTKGDRSEDVKENKNILPQIVSAIRKSLDGINVQEILEDTVKIEFPPFELVLLQYLFLAGAAIFKKIQEQEDNVIFKQYIGKKGFSCSGNLGHRNWGNKIEVIFLSQEGDIGAPDTMEKQISCAKEILNHKYFSSIKDLGSFFLVENKFSEIIITAEDLGQKMIFHMPLPPPSCPDKYLLLCKLFPRLLD